MADANVMLVEGSDDWNVLFHLLKYYYTSEQLTVVRKGDARLPAQPASREVKHILFDVVQGSSMFRPKALSAQLKASGLEKIGLVVDADADSQLSWQKLSESLTSFGYNSLPSSPDAAGTLVEQEGYPTVGIWVMPDNRSPGALEECVSLLKPAGDALWSRAEAVVAEIPEEERRFKPQARTKAQVHTWLAWQEEPGTPLGQALTKRYLDAEAQDAVHLVNWLRRLFALEAVQN